MSSNESPYLSSADDTLIDKRTSLPSHLCSPTVSEAGDFEAILRNEDTPMLSARGQEYRREEAARRYQAQVDTDAAEEAAVAQIPGSPVIDISTSPSSSPSPPPLIREANEGVIFPDRETYLTTPVAYMMGLIEGTPNTEFVSGPTRPEIQRALEILEEERSFVRHAQRALQIREGTIIARINAGQQKLMGLQNLRDSFHPADDPTPSTEYHMPTTAVVSRALSSASNGAPLHPMPGTYPTRTDRERDVYRFAQVSPRYHIIPARLGLIRSSTRTRPPLPFTEYDSSESDTAPVVLRPRGA
ncbi:hypothetical protein HETIRDRAFT_117063 [Heterobasidion irregulare TC 32-1]|uniref:Uncharacterized protein n=1 Tax=Heterobasidion irregulare (strain TC 32-1) TaxID=747525 RepID=W4K4I1_HETIT|nr:uncharacterized protein HETIRDRAFT_117063 [Heterobasidion irregulare TC 32-1]ETW79951.1 hypothetical protein HETIRDRAFT_117063 [Heterobasidion irregulare TC 32-1]